MGWDPSVVPHPQDPATFHRSMLDWSELGEAPHARILSVYRELIRLRRSVPELTDARFGALSAEADDATLSADGELTLPPDSAAVTKTA